MYVSLSVMTTKPYKKKSRYSVIWVATILYKLCFLQNSPANTLLSWPLTCGNIMLNPTVSFMNIQSAAELIFMFAFASVVVHWAIVKIQGEHKVFPLLQTFITRKLSGIQKEHMLKCTDVL